MADVTLFFPENCNLTAVTVEGPVPRKGEIIFFRTQESLFSFNDQISDRHDYKKYGNKWIVKDVHYSTMVWADLLGELERKYLEGKPYSKDNLPKNKIRVEVHLEQVNNKGF